MSRPIKVLIVDDEPALVDLVRYNLEQAGFATRVVSRGDEVLSRIDVADPPDVIVLDILLPGMDGLDICRELRFRGINVPVLMLTALGGETDRVVGLEVGADDYLSKPFSPRELVARVRALARRSRWDAADLAGVDRTKASSAEKLIRVGELVIDHERHEVTYCGRSITLTPTEYRLLSVLAAAPGRAFHRDELLNAVWGEDYVGDTRLADVHISHLRGKLEEDPAKPNLIHTVRGYGYRLDVGPKE